MAFDRPDNPLAELFSDGTYPLLRGQENYMSWRHDLRNMTFIDNLWDLITGKEKLFDKQTFTLPASTFRSFRVHMVATLSLRHSDCA